MRLLRLVAVLARVCVALTPQTRGIALPGGGLFFWWQLGAMTRLRREFGGPPPVPLIGASAGGLASVCAAADVDPVQARELAIEMCELSGVFTRGKWGLAGVWGVLVREWLYDLLPSDAAARCENVKLVMISRNETAPVWSWKRKIAGPFDDTDDLVDAALASAHVPLFLDGALQARWRDQRCIDGAFRMRNLLARDYGGYVPVDPLLDGLATGASSLSLPTNFQNRQAVRAWLDEVGARGFDWADRELEPGGHLHSLTLP